MKLVPIRVSIKFPDSQKHLFDPLNEFVDDTCNKYKGHFGDTFHGADTTRKVYRFTTVYKATSFTGEILSKATEIKGLEITLEIISWGEL